MVRTRFKLVFFDDRRVIRAMDPVRRRALSHAGGYARTVARRSIRKRKRTSEPGHPPSSHTGLLRKLIYYAYDRVSDSVVVGPVPFGRGEAPSLLEHGGTVVSRRVRTFRGGAGRDRRGRYTQGEVNRIEAGTRMVYRPRPFMGPALEKTAPLLPGFFQRAELGIR